MQSEINLEGPSTFKFANLLIQYLPKIYFLASRLHENNTGDTFIEIINTTKNEIKITLEPIIAENINQKITAELLPLPGVMELSIKDSTKDEILIIDDVTAFQKLPKTGKSALLKISKNFAIIQLAFLLKTAAPSDPIIVFLHKFMKKSLES